MPAVSDTSPIFNLACIGRLDLLRTQFEKIWVPSGVETELSEIPDAAIRGSVEQARNGGVLGVLLRAKRLGQIAAIKPDLLALRSTARFFISRELEAEILESAGE